MNVKLNELSHTTIVEIYIKTSEYLTENDIKFIRFKSMQACYTENYITMYGLQVRPFISYNTLVGVELKNDNDDNIFIEFRKYSTTTSKQVTQFCNHYNLFKLSLNDEHLENMIEWDIPYKKIKTLTRFNV